MGESAVLMAAGMGTRMMPLTKTTPKPLIRVHGTPMIETMIDGLLQRQVERICIVTGFLHNQFQYLAEKYPQAEILYNPYFETQNNISSLYIARKFLAAGDCFICESDIYVKDLSIFQRELFSSCYYGRMQEGYSDDWVFDLEEERIVRIGRGGTDTYNMTGIAFFKGADALMLKEKIEDTYRTEKNRQMFWDEVVNANLDTLSMKVEPVETGQLYEIDTVKELWALESSTF